MKRLAALVVTALLALSLHGATEDSLLAIALDARSGVVERTRAFADLRVVATDRSIPALADLLKDPAWSFSARSVLQVMPGPAADRALLAALESATDLTLQAGIVNSLGGRRSAVAVPAIANFLASPDPALAGAALDALGEIGTVSAGDALAAHRPPATLAAAWADAMLRVADALPSSARAKSAALYQTIIAKGTSSQLAAATLGLARRSEQPVATVVAALRSEDRALRLAALALIRGGEFGLELTDAVGRSFPMLPTEAQIQVLSVLHDRADRAAAAIARHALTMADSAVRAAAANLLSVVGDAADAPALLRMMAGQEEPASAARLALSRIPGEETTQLVLESFRGGGEARAAALEVLVSRGYRALLPELLRPEFHADETTRAAAANAILALGTGADLGEVLALHRKLQPAQRGPLEGALRRLALKHPSPDEAAVLVFAAAEKLPVAEAGPLFVVVAGIGGDAAFTSLCGLLKSPLVDVRKAALRALGNWKDSRPAPALLAMAREESDVSVRAVAVQSATAVFARSAYGGTGAVAPQQVPAVIAGLRRTWEVAEQPAERNAIVVALRGLKDAKAIAAAEELEKTERPAK